MLKLQTRSLGRILAIGLTAALILSACAPAAPSPTAAPAKPAATTAPAPAPTAAPKPAATTAPAAAPTTASAAKPVVRKINWIFPTNTASGTFYAFFAARDLKFWADEGLDVNFVASGGSGAAVQQMIAGQVDAGIPSMPATLNAVSKGQKLTAFYQYSTGTLFFLRVPKDSPVQSLKDLKGKTIGISEPGGGEVPMVKAALKGVGLDPEKDVRLIPIGEGGPASFQAIKSGQVAAYASNFQDNLMVQLAGLEMRDITPKEFDAFPAQMMLATPDSLKKNREALTILARGVAKGTLWCPANKSQCEALIKTAAKEQWADPRIGLAQLDNSIRMGAVQPGKRAGEIQKDPLNAYLKFQQESDPEFKPPKLEEFLDTTLLEEINKFDKDAVLKVQYKP